MTRKSAPSDGLPERLRPRRVPTQRRSARLVDAIVEAAERELSAHGWHGLSMARIASTAGVSPGSLYQYFPDKAALVAEIIERQSEREVAFQTERMAEIDPRLPIDAVIEQLVRNTLAFQQREGPLMRATLAAMPFVGRHPRLVARVRTVAAAMEALLARDSATSPPLATHVLANAVHSLTHDGALPRPEWLDDETLVREVMRLVRGYLGDPQRGEERR